VWDVATGKKLFEFRRSADFILPAQFSTGHTTAFTWAPKDRLRPLASNEQSFDAIVARWPIRRDADWNGNQVGPSNAATDSESIGAR